VLAGERPASAVEAPNDILAVLLMDDDATLARLEQLDTFEFDLLTLIALSNRVSRTDLRALAAEVGISPEPGRELQKNEEVEPALQKFLAGGLVVEVSPGYFDMWTSAVLAVLRRSLERGRLEQLAVEPTPRGHRGTHRHTARRWSWDTAIRLAVVCERQEMLNGALMHFPASASQLGDALVEALGVDPERRWLAMVPDGPRTAYLRALLSFAVQALVRVGDAVCDAAAQSHESKVRMQLARYRALSGVRDEPVGLDGLPKWGAEGVAVIRAFCAGDYAKATQVGEAAVAAMSKRKYPGLDGIEGLLHALATVAMASSDPRQIGNLGRLASNGVTRGGVESHDYDVLSSVYRGLRTGVQKAELAFFISLHHPPERWISLLVHGLALAWLGRDRVEHRAVWVDALRHQAFAALALGALGLAREFEAVAAVLANEEGPRGLVHRYAAPAPWEAALASLEALASEVTATEPLPPERELAWEVIVRGDYTLIQPRIRDTVGRAKKGTKVSVAVLLRDGIDALSTSVDHQVLRHLAATPMEHQGSALVKLVGHPRVIDAQGEPVVVEAGRPVIRSSVQDGKIELRIEPAELAKRPVVIQWTSPQRVVVYAHSPAFERFSMALSRQPSISIPEQERARLQRALVSVAVAAGADLQGELALEGPAEPANPRPVMVMTRSGEALTIRARVAPFGVEGPHFVAGQGPSLVMADLPKQPLSRRDRDLGAERQALVAVVERCPRMAGLETAEHEWVAPTLPEALDVMLELGALGDAVTLAWPNGKPLRPPEATDAMAFRLSVMDADAWLSVQGALEVDEALVLSFEQLLAARLGDRYVALSHERFLALSEDLRQRLDALATLGQLQGESLQLSPAMLPMIESLAGGIEHATFDDKTKARLQALTRAEQETPRLPSGFRAKLRDYQRNGYAWLWRRASAGLGACLADDMGLGKTVQALALLVHRAAKGPAVVFCPTSVLLNWDREAARFAPGLRRSIFANAGDRADLLASLGPKDLLICSYGLLAQESELLSEAFFATAVFDEAHALKNTLSQRTQAARGIHAGARIALTGTPIENNLGELWSLFDVLIPGLLGSKAMFEQRLSGPISAGNKERAQQLRAVMRHFVLRRTKGQVLEEPPPRTELNLTVEMPPAARAFYEALRQRAVQSVAKAKGAHKRVQLLAELMRMRQAAIDPRLIDADHGPSGRKIEVLLAQLQALRDEGHRALVFTQFLGSMGLVREGLEQAGLRYTEFDGSTPAAERARRIEAFQTGEIDVFLLSLRAGGIGINLTEADYVFHLDPWWNPAVEDQATDRAHRLGQTRPVTVYRLISAGTIEEKILLLHETKRGLADDFLGDLEGSTRLDFDALFQLLRD